MATTTAPETVWYRNVAQDTLHEVVKGSALERRLRKEQREIIDAETGDSDFEPAYEKVTPAELKAAQSKPQDLPGYPAQHEAKRLKAEAEERRQKAREEAIDSFILAQAQTQTSDTKDA